MHILLVDNGIVAPGSNYTTTSLYMSLKEFKDTHTVEHVVTQEEALQRIKNNPSYDLVITDWNLGWRSNGFVPPTKLVDETVRRGIRTIVLTSKTTPYSQEAMAMLQQHEGKIEQLEHRLHPDWRLDLKRAVER
jgi:CheY-like chemotaxis protein